MIEVHQLERRYGDFVAVDNVSFKINHGEIVGLLGHNGAGKTTIMKMLTGFIEPSAGTVLVDGINVQDEPLKVQTTMGYLPESLPLYPELTVADYLSHTAELRGLAQAESVAYAIEATQLTEKAFERIDTLSRGYKQRLGVAQAILHRPKILILDEPSNGLDPNQIREMRNLIHNLAKEATVILSTHIMQEVNAVCDRALILRNGELAVDENLATLKQTKSARLRTSQDVDVQALMTQQSGIGEVERIDAGDWRIALDDDSESQVAQIANHLVGNSAPIYHLALETRDLETIFAEVNDEGRDQEAKDAA